MQNTAFFGQVLRSMGYTCISLGARVATTMTDGTAGKLKPEEAEYGGMSHQINLLVIEGKKYWVDVGFGSAGPTFPVPVEEGFESVNVGVEGRVAMTMRVVRDHIANNTGHMEEQKLWQYQVKYGVGADESKNWIPCYCFCETEYFPRDFDVVNAWISTSRQSMFVNKIICQKYVMSEDGEDLIGDITLNDGNIKERRYGQSKLLTEIKSEKDRTDALEKYLGVILSEPEKTGILGFPSMIKG